MNLIKTLEYTAGLNQLAGLALKRELIPVFGAGFTAGCSAISGAVPDSEKALKSMRKMIGDSPDCQFRQDELDEMNFFEISNLFFEYVSVEKRASYFESEYTGVQLYPNQIDFLMKIKWPYAYTINIDDGIETNSDFNMILPYHKFRHPKTSKKLLYKLHGDAAYESQYIDDNQQNIVFSQKQYMQAITDEKNTDIYDALLSDYSQRHLLFVGCSLQSESDLQYIYERSKAFQKDTFRIVLRKSIPSIREQQNLRDHGVNEIILIDDYEKFYPDFLSTYLALESENRTKLYAYMNPEIKFFNDRENSLQFLAGSNIFNTEQNKFNKGAFHILRNAVKSAIAEVEQHSYVLIKGRRFSGKTYCLCSLADHYKTKDVFYFPSTLYVDEDILQDLFSSSQNSLFLFDSNSITPDTYSLILRYAPKLKEKNNYMIVAANTNDNHLISELQCDVIDLPNIFVDDEISLSQKALDSYGIIRRQKGQTNIDYLYRLKEQVKEDISIFFEPKGNLVQSEKAVLIALSALDKLYISDLIALNFSQNELNILCKKLAPVIEVIPTAKDEITRHSAEKLVHNSKIALIELLKRFTPEEISVGIQRIVKRFKPDYSRRRLYIEVILFDTISQIFAEYEQSQSLIYKIYADLQPFLNDDLHYWLQRAKSVYRTTSTLHLLNDAYEYALKAYADGNRALCAKASLTLSLISCAIAEQYRDDKKLKNYEVAIVFAHEAVFSEYFSLYPTYLNTELPIGKNKHSERRMVTACKYVKTHSSNDNYIAKCAEILDRFEELRKQNRDKRKR